MGVTQCFIMALKSLSTSKMRAFLTMLGIIIGVAAVILIMSMGNGLQVYINDMFAELGTTTITVSITGRGSTRSISVDDMYEFYDENSEMFYCMSPTVSAQGQVRTGVDTETYYPSISGVGEEYTKAKKQELEKGRNIAYMDIENNSKVCVVGAFYDYLYNDDIVGQTIKINGDKYTVIGVVEELDDRTDEDGSDNFVYVPYSTAAKFLSRNATISSYTFLAANEDVIDECKSLIETRLYKTFQNEDLYFVFSNSEIVDSMNDMVGIVVTVLSGIAAISLVVGGIGIMNIMLVSVTERTREIGIRKALGATYNNILQQFLVESMVIGIIGGTLGVILGVSASVLISKFAGWNTVISIWAIIIAVVFSVGIGLFFGIYPARKAALLDPIDALRYE